MLRLGARMFVKQESGGVPRGSFVRQSKGYTGIVATEKLLQVFGPARVRCDFSEAEAARWRQVARVDMAAKARRHRLPSRLRYDANNDPRVPHVNERDIC